MCVDFDSNLLLTVVSFHTGTQTQTHTRARAHTHTHTHAHAHTHTHTHTHTHVKALTLSNAGRKQNAVLMMYDIILMEELATGRRYVFVLTGRVSGWEGQEGARWGQFI